MKLAKLLLILLPCSCIELKQPKFALGQTVKLSTGETGVIIDARPGKTDPKYTIRLKVGNSIDFTKKGITLQRGIQYITESEVVEVK